MTTLEFRWTVSRGRETYGYNICTLYVDGRKVARCNGGGYDMKGTCLGNWIAREYADRLLGLKPDDMPERAHYDSEKQQRVDEGRYFYGLTFHDPSYDPGKAVIGTDCSDRTTSKESAVGKTVNQAEDANISFGLERLQAAYRASSKFPTERHTIPLIDGACGQSSVEKIAKAIGLEFSWVPCRSKKLDIYQLHDAMNAVTA